MRAAPRHGISRPEDDRSPTLEEAREALRRFKLRGLAAFALLGLSLGFALKGFSAIMVYVIAFSGIGVYLTALPERRTLRRFRESQRNPPPEARPPEERA